MCARITGSTKTKMLKKTNEKQTIYKSAPVPENKISGRSSSRDEPLPVSVGGNHNSELQNYNFIGERT